MKRLSSIVSFEYCPQSNRADFAKTHGTKITLESQSFMCSIQALSHRDCFASRFAAMGLPVFKEAEAQFHQGFSVP